MGYGSGLQMGLCPRRIVELSCFSWVSSDKLLYQSSVTEKQWLWRVTRDGQRSNLEHCKEAQTVLVPRALQVSQALHCRWTRALQLGKGMQVS